MRSLRKQKSQRNSFTWRSKLRLAWSNFLERRWRNFMIAAATSIGFIGILLAFGLGNAVVDLIHRETNQGQLPAQIQVSLNAQTTGGGVLNQSDIDFIYELVGKDQIKYLESPFSTLIQTASIEGKQLDLSQSLPNYAQLVSLYTNSEIAVPANTEGNLLAGNPYKDSSEEGITVPITFIEDFNRETKSSYTAESLIGKEVQLVILENTEKGSHTATVSVKISRVLTDELADSNSYMAPVTLEKILQQHQFVRLKPYVIFELGDPSTTEAVVESLKENKKYTVLSQQEVLGLVIQFIRVIQGLLVVLSFQAVVVSTIMIGIIVYINIMQRSREIGVMKAVGYLNRDVQSIFLYESLIITFLSLVVAFLVSQVIGSIANVVVRHFYPSITKVFFLDLQSILMMIGLGLVLGYLSAYFPTKKISQLDPVVSLRYE
ncbi:ABC transporter permease [Streptococcus danieliae]